MKQKPKQGDRVFRVAWIDPKDCQFDDVGDVDSDATESLRKKRDFTRERDAIRFAETVDDFFGCPECNEMRFDYHDELAAECGERMRWVYVREIEPHQ